MTGYDGQSWTWKGRQLADYTNADNEKTSYTYNADGIRTKKTTGNRTTEYFLNGDQILMMKTTEGTGDDATEDIIWFFYDSQGQRVGLCRNGTYMYYLYNLQGDVMAIASAGTGELVATYKYDTWGNCEVSELSGYAIGDLNPFRYRGYFWDEESGMYYLNSRYYSPEFGRFISADSQINSDILGTNLFAYCSNNPVNRTDDQGTFWDTFLDIASTAYSLWNVIKNPKEPSNWVALATDVVCLAIPCVTGGGTIVRAAKYADEAADIGATAYHATNTGWHVGDDISKKTRAGNDPAWSTVQNRYWKNEAHFHPEKYTDENLGRMNKGRAPLVKYEENGKYYSMELHHIQARSEGGLNTIENLLPVTPWDHDAKDKYRHFNPK